MKYYTIAWKDTFSIPEGFIVIFHLHSPTGRTMALRSSKPPTERNSRNLLAGKGGRCVGLTALPLSCVDCLKLWEPQTPGNLWACPSR